MLLLNITTKTSRSGKEVPQHGVSDLKASRDEYEFAKMLNHYEEQGKIYRVSFQPHKITLIEKHDGMIKNGRASTYTPDFEFFKGDGKDYCNEEDTRYVIEIKGFSGRGTQAGYNNMRHKLADIVYSKQTNTSFNVLKGKGKITDGTKGFYDMYNPNLFKNKDTQVIRNNEFFKLIGIDV